MALESGDIDMMSGYGALSAIKKLKDDERFQLIMKTQNTSAVMFFNLEKAPLDSLKVRQAISQAIDLDSIVTNLLVGLASPPAGFFSPAYGDIVNPDVVPTYDVEKAKALLEEDGWVAGSDGILEKGGAKLSISLTYSMSNTEDALLAPVIKDELKKIGIDVTLVPAEDAALWDLATEKDFELIMIGQWFIPTDEPAMNYSRGYWHTGSNCPIYTSPELDALIDELDVTLDKAKRTELHHKIQEMIMANAPTLTLYHRNSIRLADKNITNFDISSGCWHINRNLKDAVVVE
jgi:peptide/nickel transport system substrate-binding protein